MQSATFTCEVITPMFMAGADGTTPELRAPSIKGVMRYWWRAISGHLRLAELKAQEGAIFGDTGGRSLFTINVETVSIKTGKARPTPHRRSFEQDCMLPGSTFEVVLRVPVETTDWNINKCKALFELTCLLGDFGKRARRGMGSVDIQSCSDPEWQKKPTTLEHILALLNFFSPYYTIDKDKIKNGFNGSMDYYPWIRNIQIGEPDPGILQKISETTHKLHAQNRNVYEASLGHASFGRFASPVYVSVVKGSLKPLITTLNTIPDRDSRDISLRLQDEFKNNLLNHE